MRARFLPLVGLGLVFLGVGGCTRDGLNEKHVWVAAMHGFEGGTGALVDAPVVAAATLFAKRNGLAVTSSGTPCMEPACDLAAARAAGAATVLTGISMRGGLELKLVDAASGTDLGHERVADPSAAGPAVDRLLYARFGGTAVAPPPAPVRPAATPIDVDAEPVMAQEDDNLVARAAPKNGGEEQKKPAPAGRGAPKGDRNESHGAAAAAAAAAAPPSSSGTSGKGKPGVELKRGDANGGTLILTSDALHWKPGGLNLAGARAQKFGLNDVKRIFTEGGKLAVQVSWGPTYTFDTSEDEMRWRNAIDDARSKWTGQPRDK